MRRPALLIIALAFVLRFVVFGAVACCPARYTDHDTRTYVIPAYHVRAGYFEPKSAAFRSGVERVVGYPALIAAVHAVHGSLPLVLLVQIVIGVAVVVLLLRQRAWLGNRGSLVAGVLLAIEPVSIMYANQLLSETLFTALLTAGVLLLLDSIRRDEVWRLVLVGLILSFASLTRPIGLYLPVVLVPVVAVLLRSKRGRAFVLVGSMLIAYLLPVAGWMTHVHRKTGAWVFSTAEGYNLLEFRAAGAVAAETGVPRKEVARRLELQLAQSGKTSTNPGRTAAMQQSYAVRVLIHHPVGAVKSGIHYLAATAFGRGAIVSGRILDGSLRWVSLPLAAAVIGVTVLLWIGGAAGVWAFASERRWAAAVLPTVVIAYLMVSAAVPGGSSRYRVPAIPLLCFLAGRGLPAAFDRVRGRSAEADVPA